MIPNPPDRFEEWLNAPVSEVCGDPRFEVRRALPDDFERIYDAVDLAFGKTRPRAVYDWMYRSNPSGLARCWIMIERESGEIVKTGADFPWPIWRGDEPLLGGLGGDAGTIPRWQRKGLSRTRRLVRQSHPWHGQKASIAGPNERSRAVSKDADRTETLLGFLPGCVRLLDTQSALRRLKLPSSLAIPLGAAADAVFSSWGRAALRAGREGGGRVEAVRRFDAGFDDVTLRTMRFPMFWSPHNMDFLNWRYFDHPGESYTACALVEGERPTGYAVLRLGGEGATLAEFAVDREPSHRAARLLDHVLEIARAAGCAYLNFFATPSFRHWSLLRGAGFLPYRTKNFFEGGGQKFEPEINRIENWQVGPGDRDYH